MKDSVKIIDIPFSKSEKKDKEELKAQKSQNNYDLIKEIENLQIIG